MRISMTAWLLLTLACSNGGAPVTATQPSAPPPAPTRPAGPRNITIDAIEVANPLVVTGLARTFENNVVLRVRDARGNVIVQDYTTAQGDMGQHNPYRATLWLTRDPGPRITVEALEFSARDGSETNLVRAERAVNFELTPVQLDFPNSECTGVVAFRRNVPKTQSIARLLVEALLQGPAADERAAGVTSPFPQGSGVRSVNLRDGVLTVDFNERLQNVGGACRAEMIRASVTRTLKRLPSVREVVVTAAGSRELALQP